MMFEGLGKPLLIMASALFLFGAVCGVGFGYKAGQIERRQSVEAVACEPTVVGLRKNGKEIPLTSAQRDSLAKGLTTRPR